MRIGDVRVDLRGGNVGVSEKLLDGANIGLMLNEMRRKTVAKRVRRNVFESDFARVFFDEKKNCLAVNLFAQTRYKEIVNFNIFLFAP